MPYAIWGGQGQNDAMISGPRHDPGSDYALISKAPPEMQTTVMAPLRPERQGCKSGGASLPTMLISRHRYMSLSGPTHAA